MPPCFPLTLACYSVACTLCFVAVAQPQVRPLRWLAMAVLVAGLLCQGTDIAWLCQRGQHPGSSAREALYFVSFLLLLALPLTANGKLDQRALPRPVEGVVERATQTAPRTPWETELVAIWKSVLRIEQVGIHDHFMDLGGDSILSIQVLARCRQRGRAGRSDR